MFSDWALANLSMIHDEPFFHEKLKNVGLFFQHIMLRWRDIEKKKFAQKNPDDQGVNTQFALCIQVFGIHYTTGTKIFKVAFLCLQTSNFFIFLQFYAKL